MPSSLCTRELEICGLKLFLSSPSPQFLFLSLLSSLSGLTMSPLSKFILRLPYKDNQVMEFYQQVDKGIKAVQKRIFLLYSTTGMPGSPTKMARNGGDLLEFAPYLRLTLSNTLNPYKKSRDYLALTRGNSPQPNHHPAA